MPHAVTHVLIPIILLSLFRDFFLNDKQRKRFPLHYVLIAGVAGLLPDIDVIVYYVMSFFGYSLSEVHRTFSHNLFVVLLFVVLGVVAYVFGFRNKELGKHHLRLDKIFYVIAFGVFVHLVLDFVVAGIIMPFYPLSDWSIGLNTIRYLPNAWQDSFVPSLDAGLLILWLVYMEFKHKISDFI